MSLRDMKIVVALAISASPVCERAQAQIIIPVDQDRHVSTENVNAQQCSGDFLFESDTAKGFGPFDGFVETEHSCDSGAAFASASQQSQIGAASMSGQGSTASEAHGPVSGVVHAFGISFFEVTFQLGSLTDFALNGEITADAFENPVVGVLAGIKLTGPGGELIFDHLVQPGPGGEINTQRVDEAGVLEPGQYVLQAQAGTFIDNDVPPSLLAQAAFDFTLDVSIVGDLDDDGMVGTSDLLALLGAWGPCPEDCPADLDGDGEVATSDLLILLANWG
jgi:hypothetical protein